MRNDKNRTSARVTEGRVEFECFRSVNAVAQELGTTSGTLANHLRKTGAFYDEDDQWFLMYKDSTAPPLIPTTPTHVGRKWTAREDRIVCGACRLLGTDRWQDIVRLLEGRTARDVETRWRRTLSRRVDQEAAAAEAMVGLRMQPVVDGSDPRDEEAGAAPPPPRKRVKSNDLQ